MDLRGGGGYIQPERLYRRSRFWAEPWRMGRIWEAEGTEWVTTTCSSKHREWKPAEEEIMRLLRKDWTAIAISSTIHSKPMILEREIFYNFSFLKTDFNTELYRILFPHSLAGSGVEGWMFIWIYLPHLPPSPPHPASVNQSNSALTYSICLCFYVSCDLGKRSHLSFFIFLYNENISLSSIFNSHGKIYTSLFFLLK